MRVTFWGVQQNNRNLTTTAVSEWSNPFTNILTNFLSIRSSFLFAVMSGLNLSCVAWNQFLDAFQSNLRPFPKRDDLGVIPTTFFKSHQRSPHVGRDPTHFTCSSSCTRYSFWAGINIWTHSRMLLLQSLVNVKSFSQELIEFLKYFHPQAKPSPVGSGDLVSAHLIPAAPYSYSSTNKKKRSLLRWDCVARNWQR